MAGPSTRHYEFAREYAKGSTIYDAAVKAGFSPTTANDKAYKWVGKSREDSMYPELWDLVQEIREAAKDETVNDIEDMKEVLRKIWKEGYDEIWMFGDEKMPTAVKTETKLAAMDRHMKLEPDMNQPSEMNVNINDAPDLSNLSIDEQVKLLNLIRKAKEKKE